MKFSSEEQFGENIRVLTFSRGKNGFDQSFPYDARSLKKYYFEPSPSVKINCGNNNYGLDMMDSPMKLLTGDAGGSGGAMLWVYDKYRNISGVGEDEGLKTIVRKLGTTNIISLNNFTIGHFTGRLSGEKDYNKRVYLYATLVKQDEKHFVIKVRTDEILHDQEW